jgi:Ca-activated chloride channel family protein
MSPESLLALAPWAAALTALVAALAEWLHARRCRRVARLAFGPQSRPRGWTRLVAPLRVAALAGVVWALVVLIAFEGSSRANDRERAANRHLLVLLDVSPSMELKDAGEGGGQTRRDRAAALLRSVLGRVPGDQMRITMGCFYTDALPLVKECADREVIMHFADNLPLHIAFRPGKTDLVKALNLGGEWVKELQRKSTTVLVLTDGDTVPDSGLKVMPSAVAEVIFAGVGDAARGTFIDGHLSRQDQASLSQLARRLGGHYHDGNRKQVPSELLRRLTAPDERQDRLQLDLRVLAIVVLTASAALLCLLPLALEWLGSAWKQPAVAWAARAKEATA